MVNKLHFFWVVSGTRNCCVEGEEKGSWVMLWRPGSRETERGKGQDTNLKNMPYFL